MNRPSTRKPGLSGTVYAYSGVSLTMLKHPRSTLGHLCLCLLLRRAVVMTTIRAVHMRFVTALVIAVVGSASGWVHQRQMGRTQYATRAMRAARAWHVLFAELNGVRRFEHSVFGTFVFVNRHVNLRSSARKRLQCHFTTARSTSEVTALWGPDAFGLMSNEKISVGSASVAHALGMSTMPLMRPSIGAVPKMA